MGCNHLPCQCPFDSTQVRFHPAGVHTSWWGQWVVFEKIPQKRSVLKKARVSFKFQLGHFKFQLGHFKFQLGHFKFQLGHFKFQLGHFKFQLGHFKFQLGHFSFNLAISSFNLAISTFNLAISSFNLAISSFNLAYCFIYSNVYQKYAGSYQLFPTLTDFLSTVLRC